MTGSFLFVKPSDQEGEREAYKNSPQYPYVHTSWEWLLERTLRRTLLPWALTKSHSRDILYGHEDQYSMHKWGSYGESYSAGSHQYKIDADLSGEYRNKSLPGEWISDTEGPTSNPTIVTYGIVDLEYTVARLPFSLEWLHPDWEPAALAEWDLTVKTVEETNGSASGNENWTWTTSVTHTPYDIPKDSPFKCLSHMRTDDDIDEVKIKNDDDESIEVEVAHTPVAAKKELGGSVRKYNGTEVRSALAGAAYGAGWTLSEFYIPYKRELDYSKSNDSTPYGRGDKTYETHDTLGCLVDVPDVGSKSIIVSEVATEEVARFAHDVDWDGKPTWWHANGFPKGLDSVISPKLREQLEDLCPVCQPAIPPAIPAFLEKFPDDDRLQWDYSKSPAYFLYSLMYPQPWMRHLTLACTPHDMSARLDAMTTTIHQVPVLFAKIRTVRTEYYTEDNEYTSSSGERSKTHRSNRSEYTVEGTSLDPIPSGTGYSVSGEVSGVGTHYTSSTDAEGNISSSSSKTQITQEESFESNSDFIVCLRETAKTTPSVKYTTKISSKNTNSADDATESETETSEGELPESYDPDPYDLLFPDWVLPWIETAELFASIDSRLKRDTQADYETSTSLKYPSTGGFTSNYNGGGSGSRTHEAHRKIISLGEMDMSTGRFPAIDVTNILSEIDPDPTYPSVSSAWRTSSSTTTRTKSSDHSSTESLTSSYKGSLGHGKRLRLVSYYVVVTWKFDRTDPESLNTESSLYGLHRILDNAKIALADKKRELADAQSALSDAQEDLRAKENDLEQAQNQLNNPESVAPELLEKAKAAIASAKKKLAEAQAKKSGDQSKFDEAQEKLQIAEGLLQRAKDVYEAAIKAGVGIEAAKENLEIARTSYLSALNAFNEVSGDLSGAEIDEAAAQQELDDAQYHYDALLEDIMKVLSDAVKRAEAAVTKARSKVDKLTRKIAELEKAIENLEEKVKEAEGAIRDAGKDAGEATRDE